MHGLHLSGEHRSSFVARRLGYARVMTDEAGKGFPNALAVDPYPII